MGSSKHGFRQRICLEHASKKGCMTKKQQRAENVKSVVRQACILV